MTRPRRTRGVDVLKAVEAAGGSVTDDSVEGAIRAAGTAAEKVAAAIAPIRDGDKLLRESERILEDGLAFSQLDRGAEGPPDEWVKQLGPERAAVKFRLAMAAWMSRADAPVGLHIAQEFVKADAKVRAALNAPPVQMNVAIVMNLNAGPVYEEIEVDE